MTNEVDASAFLNETFEMPELDTVLNPIPLGEYPAQIGVGDKDVDVQTGTKNDKPWMRLILMMEITDPNVAAQMKRDVNPKVRYDFFIDLDAAGRIDTNPQRNVKLGKLRKAVGQNKPGTWGFPMLKGCPLKVKIKHRADENDPTTIYSEVAAVTSLS